MKREIKFRAWNEENNRWATESDFKREGLFLNYDIRGNGEFEIQSDCPMRGHGRFIINQFTGLKDRNGREIYEGDIGKRWINEKDRFKLGFKFCDYWLIEWLQKTAGFTTTCIGESRDDKYTKKEPKQNSFSTRFNEIEIIGNIFENPELLEP